MLEEKIVVGEGTNYPLNGLLTLPAEVSDGPVPAVVFVHGSGSSNMDEKVGQLTPFKDLAQGLAKHGIASIRYDKRSFAHGMKMVREKAPLTVREETIDDAVLATELLKRDPRIDADRVFIVGHSMGGMLAPRIDAEGGNYRGLVLMAGTPRKLEEIMVEQSEEALRDANIFLRLIVGSQIKKILRSLDGLYEMPDEEAKKKKLGNGMTTYYFKEMGQHEAADYLNATDKPVLIMQGEKDFQVKLEKDFEMYQDLLQDRPNVSYKVYEGLNHAFVPAVADNLLQAKKEYGTERHIGEDVIADIANWIKGM